MCGIAGGYVTKAAVEAGLDAISHRGPDARGIVSIGQLQLGHVRLAIMDLDRRSNQPFSRGRITVSFNGEIWNYRDLRADLEAEGQRFRTSGDTEVLAAALDTWGTSALGRLEGMHAFAWTSDEGKTLWLARDRFGEVPVHFSRRPFAFASERKALLAMGATEIEDLGPGQALTAEIGRDPLMFRWYDPPAEPIDTDLAQAAEKLRGLLEAGARERAMTDVPACVLLSGGIDSAAIALCLKPHMPGLVAYTAKWNERSRDLRCAREAAEAIGLPLVEVSIPIPTQQDLRSVVRTIEMPHKAQVEIGWHCLKLAERMRADGFKVTFSGEGSDELWASYGFAYHALKTQGWHDYRKRLFLDQSRKNFPRCNKSFMASGIECRLPFLHRSVAEHALSLPRVAVEGTSGIQKCVMKEAFRGLLPDSIVGRPKMAFQDGTGMKSAIADSLGDPAGLYMETYRAIYGSGLEQISRQGRFEW